MFGEIFTSASSSQTNPYVHDEDADKNTGQAFVIPCLHSTDTSSQGWTIWTFTDLDWLIMQGLPVNAYLLLYHCEDIEEGQRLLADCSSDWI
jgi:hypothetical protein